MSFQKLKWSQLYLPCMPYVLEEIPKCRVCEVGELSFKHVNLFRNGYIEVVYKCVNCGITYHFNKFDKKLVDTFLPSFKAADTYRYCDVLDWDLPSFIKNRYVKIIENPTNIWDLEEVKPKIKLKCFCGSTDFTLIRVHPFKYRYSTKVSRKVIEQERTDIWLLCNECSTLHIFGVHGLAKKILDFETSELTYWSSIEELRQKLDNVKFINFLVKVLEKTKPIKELNTCPFDGNELHFFTKSYFIPNTPVIKEFWKCPDCGFTIQKLKLKI